MKITLENGWMKSIFEGSYGSIMNAWLKIFKLKFRLYLIFYWIFKILTSPCFFLEVKILMLRIILEFPQAYPCDDIKTIWSFGLVVQRLFYSYSSCSVVKLEQLGYIRIFTFHGIYNLLVEACVCVCSSQTDHFATDARILKEGTIGKVKKVIFRIE